MGYPFASSVTLPDPGECLCLVQLTDTHLCQQNGGELLGMDTDHALDAVIDRARREQARIDLVLATGDLANNGAREAYERLARKLAPLGAPSFWLPGNHDDRQQMEQACPDPASLSSTIAVGCWQVLMLDSQVPGEVGGELGEGQLDWLRRQLKLADAGGRFSLVCLHHQPLPVGCAWLDSQQTADGDRLLALLQEFPGVRGLLWGHVHQEFDQSRGQLRLLATPSTCVQFAPGSEDFRLDSLSPGYRWLRLFPDGRLETGVSRVDDETFEVDLDSTGYL